MKRKFACSLIACAILAATACAQESKNIESTNIGTMVYVPPGKFARDASAKNESVIVSGYYISQKEITYPEFLGATGLSIQNNSKADLPLKFVNWYHALIFCNRLSLREGLTPVYSIGGSVNPDDWLKRVGGFIPTGHSTDTRLNPVACDWNANGYRLPTEMEWVWAAMGAKAEKNGYKKAFAGSTGTNSIADYAWYLKNSASASHRPGTKKPNELGLYDMSGNVMEWCWDWFADYPKGRIASTEAAGRGAPSGAGHVVRGGSWRDDLLSLEFRCGSMPFDQDAYIGFRVARNAEAK